MPRVTKENFIFFKLLKNELKSKPIHLYDLHFEVNNSECQIDCLLIFQNECVLIEIKNYQGDFYMKNDGMYLLSTHEKIKNPFSQLERAETMLRHLFKKESIPLKIYPLIVFTHQEFYLYQDNASLPAVFPTQIKRFVKKLNDMRCNLSKDHFKIAEVLKSHHLEYSSYETKIKYDYDELKKGLVCEKCEGFMEVIVKEEIYCKNCLAMEDKKSATIRAVKEFRTLFPNDKITVATMKDWTGSILSPYILRKILAESFIKQDQGKKTHYIIEEMDE